MYSEKYHYNPHALRWWLGWILTIILSMIGTGMWFAITAWGIKILYGIVGLFAVICVIYSTGWLLTAVFGQEKVDRWLWKTLP